MAFSFVIKVNMQLGYNQQKLLTPLPKNKQKSLLIGSWKGISTNLHVHECAWHRGQNNNILTFHFLDLCDGCIGIHA